MGRKLRPFARRQASGPSVLGSRWLLPLLALVVAFASVGGALAPGSHAASGSLAYQSASLQPASLPASQDLSTAFTAGATQPPLSAAAKRASRTPTQSCRLPSSPTPVRPTSTCATTRRGRGTASTSPITRRCSPSRKATAARRFSCASWAPTQTPNSQRPIAPAAGSTTSPTQSATPTSPPTGGSSTATSGPASTWSFGARAESLTTSFASAPAPRPPTSASPTPAPITSRLGPAGRFSFTRRLAPCATRPREASSTSTAAGSRSRAALRSAGTPTGL